MSHTDKTQAEDPRNRPDNSPGPAGEPKPGGLGWWKRKGVRFAAISVVAVIILGTIARLVLPTVLVSVSNRQLSKHLAAPVTLNDIDLGIFGQSVTLQGLRINQPDGFAGGNLFLELPETRIKLAPPSLFLSPLTIREVITADLSVHVVRDKDGRLNVARILQPAATLPESKNTGTPVHIKRIAVKNLTLQYTDLSLTEEPVQVTINRLNAVITDVYLNMTGDEKRPLSGRAEMTGYLVQPGMPDAPLGIVARERFQYWRLLLWTLYHRPRLLPQAVSLAIYGYHFRKMCDRHIT